METALHMTTLLALSCSKIETALYLAPGGLARTVLRDLLSLRLVHLFC